MKKLTFATLACVVFSALALGAPIIQVDNAVYDFGSTFEGIAVDHTFVIRNTGDETLEISGVRASCGCTATELATTSIAPGESVDLEVLVNTTGFGGTISKSITVTSNDPAMAILSLRIMGQVIKSEVHHIPASEAYYYLYLLVDLREPDAYASHHLLGAINSPLGAIEEALADIPRETFVILYDKDGSTVDSAAATLKSNGFNFVHTLLRGLDGWVYQYGTKNLFTKDEAYATPESIAPAPSDRGSSQLLAGEFDYLFYLTVDVRSAEEYAAGHIMGAVNIPYEELEAWADVLPRNALLITYDQTGTRGDEAALWLVNNNFSSARSILGGLNEWIRQYGETHLLSDDS